MTLLTVPPVANLEGRLREITALIEPIQGWLHPAAGAALYRLARLHAPAAAAPDVVELGAWKGRSTAWLGFALNDRSAGGRVWAVDTWAGSPGEPMHRDLLGTYEPGQLRSEFCANMERLGLADHVSPIESDTVAAARAWPAERPVGLLFIDASHEYAAVRRDFEHWAPHVADGGFVVFDDVPGWPGPTRLVSELPHWYRQAGAAPNVWVVKKVAAGA